MIYFNQETRQFTNIKGFPGYSVEGNKVYRNGKEVKSYDNGQGYRQVKLYKNGIRHTKNVHRLIQGEPNCDVDHRDGNPSNNNPNNLQNLSHSENVKKSFK